MALRSVAQRRALFLGQIRQACAARGFATGEQQVGVRVWITTSQGSGEHASPAALSAAPGTAARAQRRLLNDPLLTWAAAAGAC
jgi:hypothetical protein